MRPGLWREIGGVSNSFSRGILVGMGLPLLALAGVVAGVYLWTRKIPFLADVEDQEGERRVVLKLMEPAEAGRAFRLRRAELQELRDQIRAELAATAEEMETEECLSLMADEE